MLDADGGPNGDDVTSTLRWWVPRTCAIGLAHFSGQMGAALYNAYRPIVYGAFVASNPLIGAVLPFDVASGLLVTALVVILLTIRERRVSLLYRQGGAAPAPDNVEVGRLLPAARMLVQKPNRAVFWLMLGALAWVAAVNGVQNMFTRYGVQYLKLDPSAATFLLGFFAVAFIAFSVPAGIIGDRLVRLKAD